MPMYASRLEKYLYREQGEARCYRLTWFLLSMNQRLVEEPRAIDSSTASCILPLCQSMAGELALSLSYFTPHIVTRHSMEVSPYSSERSLCD